MLAAILAGLFIWPFGYVTNYWGLFFLSIGLGLGCGGILSVNVVYMSEIIGPAARGKVMMGAQVFTIVFTGCILGGIIPHYLIPGQYRAYLFVLAGANLLLLLPLVAWRLPESPRWLEAREQRDQARKIVERMEARVMKRHPVLPEPDLTPYQVRAEEKTSIFAVFSPQYALVTIFLLVVFALGYGGIVYGAAAYGFVFMAANRGFSASSLFLLITWGSVSRRRPLRPQRLLRRPGRAQVHPARRRLLFAGSWYALYNVHNSAAEGVLYVASYIGGTIWLFNMYAFVPPNYPTRMRSLGTGWTDGVGHLGAWGGVLLCGVVFTVAAPLGWILLITIPGALVPGFLTGIFGQRQRRRALEELTR